MTAASADLRALAADLASAQGQGIEQAAGRVVHDTALQLQAIAQTLAPYKTGALKESIAITFHGPLQAVVGPGVPYGAYQEFGTASRGEFGGSPYVIEPKRASQLAFQVGGQWVFTKRVVHPGIAPHAYMRPATEQVLEPFTAQLAEAGALLITRGPKA